MNSVLLNHNDISNKSIKNSELAQENSIVHYSENAKTLKFKSEINFLAPDRNSNAMENLFDDFL
jgi:hypothetical protein